jgi:hypothetical protein
VNLLRAYDPQFDWFIKGQVMCGLPVIHAMKKTLGIIRKE